MVFYLIHATFARKIRLFLDINSYRNNTMLYFLFLLILS
jgi:hypothetical protein